MKLALMTCSGGRKNFTTEGTEARRKKEKVRCFALTEQKTEQVNLHFSPTFGEKCRLKRCGLVQECAAADIMCIDIAQSEW
jgi:hypothetical protein